MAVTTSAKPSVPSASTLPPHWEVKVNDKGRIYYIDHTTRSTSWMHPVVADMQRLADELSARNGVAFALHTGFIWQKMVNSEGRTYYTNHSTKTTSWDRPVAYNEDVSMLTANFADHVSEEKLPEGWELQRSPLHGYALFVNRERMRITHIDPRTTLLG